MKKKKKIALAGGIAALAAAVGAAVAGEKIADLATKREFSVRADKKAASFDSAHEAAEQRRKQNIDMAATFPTEKVSLRSADGLHLVGHWYHCDQPQRIVIAMHGWRSNWAVDFGSIIAFFHKEGCSVLLPDQRAQGESEGTHMTFGVMERFDALKWAQYAAEQYPDLPIYLYGVSMGATTVMMTADLPLPRTVRGIIADCGFTTPKAIWKACIKKVAPVGYHSVGLAAGIAVWRKAHFDSKVSAPEALRYNTRPLLIIHGDDDHFVPVRMGYENYGAAGGDKELLIVPGAGHAMSHYTDAAAYEAAIKRLFQKGEQADADPA